MTLAKTRDLAALFPDAYAAKDPSSLLGQLLDVVGAELTRADDSVKRVLKSHWVAYASGPALDGLASIFGVSRRSLPDGAIEPDETFRRRLAAIVPLFTGGGTVRAVLGAVRSALGLPFDFDAVALPAGLRADLEALITLTENLGEADSLTGEATPGAADTATDLLLQVSSASVLPSDATITITLAKGTGWGLRVTGPGGIGVASRADFLLQPGVPLVLTGTPGALRALAGGVEVTPSFTALDGAGAPVLPQVPDGPSDWRIHVQGAPFDFARFDVDSFGPPAVHTVIAWRRATPLTFEVTVPYDVRGAVQALLDRYNYQDTARIFVFEGLPREAIQEVVDDARAAGVTATVQFAQPLAADRLDANDVVRFQLTQRAAEDAGQHDSTTGGAGVRADETHPLTDRTVLGGVFDVSVFDEPTQGFL
ncbi:hypothetical protein [Kutzneria sp. NPDC052558]|uniref:hypothetical protein n=1 Tax=Kutzneria sp. NPDC052558 TaxID=3364121 RepID=UPI0037C59B69